MAGLMSGEYTWKGRIAGWIFRANSSNTRCWYSISVTKRAARLHRGVSVRVLAARRVVRRGARTRARIGVVRDVGQERRVEVQDIRRHRHRVREVTLDETGLGHVLRQSAERARDELAVR